MSATVVSRWTGDELRARDDCDVAPARMLAADSWLVTGGRALGLERHRRRFAEAVTAGDGPGPEETEAFWRAAVVAIPREGDWFPRVELRRSRDRAEFQFRLREAPRRGTTIAVVTHDGPDPRTAPRTKGPDLEAMMRLRIAAQGRGADEAVILGPGGEVVEGSTSCLCWWADGRLHLPDPRHPRIDSVALAELRDAAARAGVEIVEADARPAELAGAELWALNALHGIRRVTRWVDGPRLAEAPERQARWTAVLAAGRQDLPIWSNA